MKRSKTPPHLPTLPSDRDAYEDLYRWCHCLDLDGILDNWREKQIPIGLSAPEVYRRLPSAPDFEYGGYLTKTRIRFIRGDATRSYTDTDKPCTFHSHPTALPAADIPSETDVYGFLKWRHFRAITIGAEWIWVWDKNKQVLSTAKRLLKWEFQYMSGELYRLYKKHPEDFTDRYVRKALRVIGVDYCTKPRTHPGTWRLSLSRCTGIETTLITRTSDAIC